MSSTSREDPRKLAAAFYDRFADEYQSWEGETNWPRLRWLQKVLDRLSPGSAVLDLGCGSGDPADIEIAKRHNVTGVDISAEQIRRASRNVANGQFIHGDLASVDQPDESFDAVVSFYALDQVPRAEHQVILQRCYALLRPGGFLLLSLETVNDEAKYGNWQGSTVMLSAFDEATTLRIVTEAGLSVIETATETQMERDHEVPFLWILAQRPE